MTSRAPIRLVGLTRVRNERALIVGRFFQGRSQQDLADELGISQSYLSRVLRRVLARLREEADGAPGGDGG